MNSAKTAVWILVGMAIMVFAVVPTLQITLGGSPYLWGTVTLVLAIFGWILYRRAIAPPKVWRNDVLNQGTRSFLVQVRESRSLPAGTGSLRVLADGVQIEFPDRESLLFAWDSITSVTTEQEKLGRKWRLHIRLLGENDPVVLYPLTADGVSMATGAGPAQELLDFVNAGRSPLGGPA